MICATVGVAAFASRAHRPFMRQPVRAAEMAEMLVHRTVEICHFLWPKIHRAEAKSRSGRQRNTPMMTKQAGSPV